MFGSDRENVKTAWRKLQIEVCLTRLRCKYKDCQARWQRRLKRGSTATRLLGSRVRIAPGAWMPICCEFCLLSERSLCDELITSPREPYRACLRACVRVCVCVCHLVWSLITIGIPGSLVVTPRVARVCFTHVPFSEKLLQCAATVNTHPMYKTVRHHDVIRRA